ncbi:MAG: hypothetical protein K0V04_20120, partial [Deltaproteobacteria bacterium]|nr:hypothetical protein [Deltaproteobacteria bacterium]
MLGLAAGLGFSTTACRSSSKTAESTNTPDLREWTLAEIEAELARNDAELSNAGILVAQAQPPPGPSPKLADPVANLGSEAGEEPEASPSTPEA